MVYGMDSRRVAFNQFDATEATGDEFMQAQCKSFEPLYSRLTWMSGVQYFDSMDE